MGKSENKWGPFEGQVVDAESGEGIAGAAVIVHWMKAMSIFNPAIFVEGHDEFDDARWAVTDRTGHFVLPRRKRPWFRSGTTKAYLTCVAPGYFPYEFTPTDIPKHSGCSPIISTRLQEGFIEIEMKPLAATTRGERLKALSGSTSNLGSIPDDRFRQISDDINAERAKLGLRRILVRYGEFE